MFFLPSRLSRPALSSCLLKTESTLSLRFMESNPLRQGDKFINKELTGTGQMCIVFKMRDRVSLAGGAVQRDLTRRIDEFTGAYRQFQNIHPDLKYATVINSYILDDLDKMKKHPERNQDGIEERVAVFTDILNEYFETEQKADNSNRKMTASPAGNDLSDMADDYASVSGNHAAMTAKEAGVESIIGRIKTAG